jgi:hypothetical protein
METLRLVHGVPVTKRDELAGQSASDEKLREGLVNYFLRTSPYICFVGGFGRRTCVQGV